MVCGFAAPGVPRFGWLPPPMNMILPVSYITEGA